MDDTAQALTAAKRAAGYLAADMVKDGMVLGLGTGSTVFYALERLSCRVQEGLKISGVPTSHQTAVLPVNTAFRLPRLMRNRYLISLLMEQIRLTATFVS